MSNAHKKLEYLSKEQRHPLFNLYDIVKLVELDIVPPEYVLHTPALGPKNPVLEKFDRKVMLAEIDLLFNRLQEKNVSNETISDVNIATINYIKKGSKQSIPRNLIMTKNYLKEHNLLAVPFDKGTGIFLIKSKTYKNELMDILKLKQFKKMEKARKNAKEFCLKEEERINIFLEDLNGRCKVNEQFLKSIKSVHGQLPRLYGLAKIHKENIPVRPVLSMSGLPYYKLAEKITEWLSVISKLFIKANCG